MAASVAQSRVQNETENMLVAIEKEQMRPIQVRITLL